MGVCKDCGIEFKKLTFHHDPPSSKIFKEGGTDFFIDKDGKKKIVIFHKKNRKLCRKCHIKADKEWRIIRNDIFKKKKK